MPARSSPSAVLGVACTLLAASGIAWADGPDYRRPREHAAVVTRPDRAIPVPRELGPRTGQRKQTHSTRRDPVTTVTSDLERRARIAAARAADHWAQDDGRVGHYRVGFYLGMRAALDDPGVGAMDYRTGRHHGEFDPGVVIEGDRLGVAAAGRVATERSKERAREQFLNLDRVAVPESGAAVPVYLPAPPTIPEPRLEDLLGEYPVARVLVPMPRELRGFGLDGQELYACPSWDRFHDPSDAAGVWFEAWLERESPRGLSPGDTASLSVLFRESFEARWIDRHGVALERAHARGVDAGWAYGAFVHEELDYREGYRDAYRDGVVDRARWTFDRAYLDTYGRLYAEEFDRWMRTATPGIGEVRLEEAGGDGIFEPGERLVARVELINYGGTAGEFRLGLDGPSLTGAAWETVALPPRTREWASYPLEAHLRAGIATPRLERIEVVLGGERVDVPLTVQYPLQLGRGSPRIERNNLDGRIEIELQVVNHGRVPVDASIELSTRSLPGVIARRSLDTIAPGAGIASWFSIEGLAPLDLIGGAVVVEATVRRAGDRRDRKSYPIAGVVDDLRNADLVLFLEEAARRSTSNDSEIRTARAYLLERLRHDWRSAVAASGNPYKYDYRQQGTLTALGEFVQSYARIGEGVARPDVYAGLSSEIMTLAGALPGVHPFLRKYVRRLASQLP